MNRTSNNNFLFFILFILLTLWGCSEKKQFVKVKGKQFILDEKPYYFVGTNFWYGCYLGSPGETGDRERLLKELDLLKNLGITNLRILASSENSTNQNSLKPAVQQELGKYNENLLIGLDFLLNEMKKRNMHAVVFLNNYWEWSGGMGQYLAWITGEPSVDPSTTPWTEFNIYVNRFYRNPECKKHFENFIKTIVLRKNTITNEYYYNDPTIMAWQLANEPRPGQGEDGNEHIDYFVNWVDETAGYIKSLDSNHLVTTGSEGTVGSLDNEEFYLRAHKSNNIDYSTFHLWAKNWGWFDAKDIEGTFSITKKNAADYIEMHMRLADSLNKPITLEEFGLARDGEIYSLDALTTARDRYFKFIFDQVYSYAEQGKAIAGTNFWSWGGFGRKKHVDAKWRNGDPFTGDPPQEPQGLNSVFNNDVTTLNIIKKHSDKMNMLRNAKIELAGK